MGSRSRSQREVLDALADVISVNPTSSNGGSAQIVPNETSSVSYSGQAPMAASEAQPSVPTKDHFDPVGPVNGTRRPGQHLDEPTVPSVPPKTGGFGRLANAFRRHHTDEKDQKRREKERRMQRAITESSRMDVIDRMDLSGLGATLFHHDSPYDACSPHSNRNARRAPVQAFDPSIDPMTGLPYAHARQGGSSSGAGGQGRPGLSPLAAATMRKMNDSAADVPDDGKGGALLGNGRNRSHPTQQMPTLGRNMTSSTTSTAQQSNFDGGESTDASSLSVNSNIDRDVDAERAYRLNQGYMNAPSNVSRGRADVTNPNADIWGMTSEPWQDFAQPANRLEPPSRGSLEGGGSAASSVFDMEAVMTGRQSAAANQPGASSLAPPSTNGGLSPASSSGGMSGGDGPKRSRSLIKKLKTARQYGNVPPPNEDVIERAEAKAASQGARVTSSGSRRDRTAQHTYQHRYSPSTPPLTSSTHYGGVQLTDDGAMTRSETMRAGRNGMMEASASNEGSAKGSASATNLGRNGSIFNRFRGNKNRERDVAAAR